MATSTTAATRFGLSDTLRGIYVIRYLLFSGGTAIAFAMVERALTQSQHSGAGLIAGFLAGLIIFRSQMRRLFWPSLLLGQQAIYMIRRKDALLLSWQQIKNISVDERFVTLELHSPMLSPQGFPTEAVRLDPRHFGTSLKLLDSSLRFFFLEPSHRQQLPGERKIQEQLGKRVVRRRPISSRA